MIDNLLPLLLLQDILFSLFTQEWDWVPAKVINGGKGKGGVGGETRYRPAFQVAMLPVALCHRKQYNGDHAGTSSIETGIYRLGNDLYFLPHRD